MGKNTNGILADGCAGDIKRSWKALWGLGELIMLASADMVFSPGRRSRHETQGHESFSLSVQGGIELSFFLSRDERK
jgi:hypothetical protein